jgi:hypothetical protein
MKLNNCEFDPVWGVDLITANAQSPSGISGRKPARADKADKPYKTDIKRNKPNIRFIISILLKRDKLFYDLFNFFASADSGPAPASLIPNAGAGRV